MKKYKNLQKILSIVLSLTLLVMPLSPVFAEGEEVPLTPAPQLQPISQPSAPTPPDPASVTEPSAPTPPAEAPPLQTVNPLQSLNQPQTVTQPSQTSGQTELQTASSPGGATSNGNVGTTNLSTGDATNSTTMSNTGNVNQAGNGAAGCCGGSATVVNDGNGAHSDNNASATTTNNNNTGQGNSASVTNNLNSATVTGQNSTSFNTGDSNLETGDANTTATIYNDINSNLAGVSVSEFNIADDYNGDYVLDFAANCILGCNGSGMDVSNANNGAGSNNNASSNTTNNNNLDQENDGTIVNNLDLSSDSGNNYASFNNGGDSSIETGDANVSANVVNFLNNNLGGNVILGVVNIFGDLVGDILLPEGYINNCQNCGGDTNVANSGNGAYSDNNASANTTNNNNTFQNNDATIENNLVLSAESGDNSTSFNTGGASSVETGDTQVDANLLNIANMNITGGDWLLVIVNEGGRWVGKILGAADGANFAGTSGTEFVVDEFGNIYASNADNGAGSTNNASTSTTNNNTVNQDNNAHVVNNLNLSANTGGNSSSYNTGGNSTITTGDAQVIANLVNFVNNNISGGKLVVAVVNIFGSWTGDFVMPGETQRSKNQATGGTENAQAANNNNSGNSTSQSSNNSSKTQAEFAAEVSETKENVSKKVTAFMGGFGSSSSEVVEEGSNTEVSVLGETLSPAESVTGAVKVNLAWLVIVLPLLTIVITGGYLMKRRVIVVRRAQ